MGKELHNKELIEENVRLNQELLKAELRIAELEKIANLHVVPNESEEDYYVILDSETRFASRFAWPASAVPGDNCRS